MSVSTVYIKPYNLYGNIVINNKLLYIQIIFRDQGIGARCERQCETECIDCTLACSDNNCLLDCLTIFGMALTDCVNGNGGNIFEYFQVDEV